MYTTIVPVDNVNLTRAGREHTVSVLRRAGVHRILLANGHVLYDETSRKENLAVLADNIAYMKSQGFEVGVWIWTYICVGSPFTKITSPDGRTCDLGCCPLDPDFLEFRAQNLQEIARLHPSLILFDDDMRFSHNGIGIGCACAHHRADMARRLGRPLTSQEMTDAFVGGPNALRDVWLDSMGDSVRAFARRMRRAVDEVDPTIRLGQCACISTFDPEGVDSFEIARLLAGSTKPYLRLIGAPYWAPGFSWGNRLADTIELSRMQRAWEADDTEIEIVAEGDVYPRPRYAVPAAYLECYDTALRADGSLHGIMKYMFDYTMSQRYETGYVDRHVEAQPLYREIDALFGRGQCVGARIYEAQHKVRTALLPQENSLTIVENSLFPPAARTAAGCAIPTVYHGLCAGLAFGENVRHLPDGALDHGLVLDLTAARFLTEMGVDVGLAAVGDPLPFGSDVCANPNIEYFTHEDEYVTRSPGAYAVTAAPGAVVDSYFTDIHGTPACYLYENRDGQRFCVFAYDLYASPFVGGATTDLFWRNYTRQTQLIRALAWVGRQPLPAVCPGHPDLYMLCKQDGDRLAVGLWNLSADRIEAPCITLGAPATDARFVNTSGTLVGNTITLSRLYPYEFAGFEVTRTL